MYMAKHAARRPEKHSSSSRPKGKSSSKAASSAREPEFTFLFTVSELKYGEPERDCYQNPVPPCDCRQYHSEVSCRVMHYRNSTGRVSLAHNYRRSRVWGVDEEVWQLANDGNYLIDEDGNGIPATEYKTCAVFACNPLLPVMVAECDPSVRSTRHSDWQLLQLHHPRGEHLEGISQVAVEDSHMPTGTGLCRYAAGRSPSWIPGLLPTSYRNPYNPRRPSRGLGGELPIILGLMALSGEPHEHNASTRIEEIFTGRDDHHGRWHDRKWRRSEAAAGHPKSAQDDPRGFVVRVYYDPDNPDGSTAEHFEYFEWQEAIVRES